MCVIKMSARSRVVGKWSWEGRGQLVLDRYGRWHEEAHMHVRVLEQVTCNRLI